MARRAYKTRPVELIRVVVIHHTGVDHEGDADDVRAIERYHREVNGWPGIGYHYVISKSGSIHKTNALTTVSYHTAGHNLHGVGVALAGNLDRTPPTPHQEAATRRLLEELRRAGLRFEVRGHRELVATVCPGRFGMELVRKL